MPPSISWIWLRNSLQRHSSPFAMCFFLDCVRLIQFSFCHARHFTCQEQNPIYQSRVVCFRFFYEVLRGGSAACEFWARIRIQLREKCRRRGCCCCGGWIIFVCAPAGGARARADKHTLRKGRAQNHLQGCRPTGRGGENFALSGNKKGSGKIIKRDG